jgi:hypothetical protein
MNSRLIQHLSCPWSLVVLEATAILKLVESGSRVVFIKSLYMRSLDVIEWLSRLRHAVLS